MPRIIVLHPVALKLLLWIKSRQEGSHVFLTFRGSPWNRHSVALWVRRARKAAGIADDAKLYGVRHAFGTRAIANGCDLKTLSVLMGHTTPTTMTERYVHLAGQSDHLSTAMFRINGGSDDKAATAPERPRMSKPRLAVAKVLPTSAPLKKVVPNSPGEVLLSSEALDALSHTPLEHDDLRTVSNYLIQIGVPQTVFCTWLGYKRKFLTDLLWGRKRIPPTAAERLRKMFGAEGGAEWIISPTALQPASASVLCSSAKD